MLKKWDFNVTSIILRVLNFLYKLVGIKVVIYYNNIIKLIIFYKNKKIGIIIKVNNNGYFIII